MLSNNSRFIVIEINKHDYYCFKGRLTKIPDRYLYNHSKH